MFDKNFWDNRYESKQTGWDIGYPSTPLASYFDALKNKNLKILIPGCGRAHEAEYLFQKGFKNIWLIDISNHALSAFSKRCPFFPKNQLIEDDFFNHQGTYDLIIEQTFFCAIDPKLRKHYVSHCAQLLKEKGQIVGLLFAHEFGNDHPPFGGSKEEYLQLFSSHFHIKHMKIAPNSIEARKGKELFITFDKKIA